MQSFLLLPALLITVFVGTGTLSSAVMLFAAMRLGSWFLGGRALTFEAELYGGLVVFMGYILYDTQVTILEMRVLIINFANSKRDVTIIASS